MSANLKHLATNVYTANGHDLRFFESPHPSPLPKGEGDKSRNPCLR